MIEFKLPAIGEGVVEGEIVRWLKQPGEPVAANEGLVEVMTDKATVEIPSPQSATLQEIKAVEGTIAAVGEVLATLSGAAATSTNSAATPPPQPPPPSPAAPPTAAAATLAAPPTQANASRPTRDGHGPLLATPAARALARETGVDLGSIATRSGRITKADVQTARDGAPPAGPATGDAPPPTSAPVQSRGAPTPAGEAFADDEYIPFRGMRRRIAEGMTKAYSTAVHYTYVEQIDVTRLVAIRTQAREAARAEGVSLSYLPFITKAVVRALKKFPIVNAFLDEANARIVLRKRYNIGIATATDQGLMVPVLHDVDRLTLLATASEIHRLSEAARAGKASLGELSGSTFTITSLGTIGGLLATPILNYPEVGILGVHAIRKTPVVNDRDEIVVGHVMNLSVSLDHRVVDGFEGASFLQEVKRYLEDPTLLLLSGT